MTEVLSGESARALIPQGVDEDCLINPTYVGGRGWGFACRDDTLDFHEIELLISPPAGVSTQLYGVRGTGPMKEVISLDRTAGAVARFFVSTALGDGCVFDLPNTFLWSMLLGDLSFVATERPKLQRIFGFSDMSKAEWDEILEPVKPEIADQLLTRYLRK